MAQHSTLVVSTVLCSLLTHCWHPATCHTTHPVIHIHNTTIQGLRSYLGEHAIHTFLGIRYAQAPKGPHRFKRPLPEKLPPFVDATRFGARCTQFPLHNRRMSEDCLFLNVYTPHPRPGNALPVLVWIHGGGFIVGTGDIFEGDVLVAEGRMIIVTLNYRLGVLGFLCTGDNSSVGNFGLWDQQVALQWVQKYIGYFGGDAGRVTLGGVSAGAASASLHSLSPLSRGLFRHVIQMSGSAGSPWATKSAAEALEAVRALAARLDCGSADSTAAHPHGSSSSNLSTQALVACIRRQRLQRLVKASSVLFPRQVALSLVDHSWGPVQDGVLVTSDLDSATPFAGPLLAGLVSNEGETLTSWIVPRVSKYILDVRELVRQRGFYRQQLLPTLLKQAYPRHLRHPYPSRDPHPRQEAYPHHPHSHPYQQLLQSIECVYFRGGSGGAESTLASGLLDAEELKEVFGDQAFVMSCLRYLDQFCGSQACYLYFVEQQSTRAGVGTMKRNDDLAYLFGFNSTVSAILDFQDHVTNPDILLARDFRQLVINFIKTGNPNQPRRPLRWPRWPQYTSKGAHYLCLSESGPRVLSHLKNHKMALWTKEVPRVLNSSANVSATWLCATSSSAYRLLGDWNFCTVHILWLSLMLLLLLLL